MPRLASTCLLLLVSCGVEPRVRSGPDSGDAQIAQAASAFVASLDAEQRASACLEFEDRERTAWHFVPGVYPGATLAQLDAIQRRALHRLLRAALSVSGYHKTTTIFGLEEVLRASAEAAGRSREAAIRDAGRYSVAVFGDPSSAAPWGFRLQGHHISWNFTSVDGHVSATPAFLGANPAEVHAGLFAGLRALPDEEDVARELLASLTPAQARVAVRAEQAPRDVLWGPDRLENVIGAPAGLAYADMDAAQRATLMRLVNVYVYNLTPRVAADAITRIEAAGRDGIHFLWIGARARDAGHYYRIHGPTFVIEYDNTQNGANHVHVVWHDRTDDFGLDTLRRHHERAHGPR